MMPKPNSPEIGERPSAPPETHWFWYPQETLIFCVVSALDVLMTIRLLNRSDVQFMESNPIANFFLETWGMAGMVYFKLTMTTVAGVISQIVARKNPRVAKYFLGAATIVIVGVVLYSVWLHFGNPVMRVEPRHSLSLNSVPVHFSVPRGTSCEAHLVAILPCHSVL